MKKNYIAQGYITIDTEPQKEFGWWKMENYTEVKSIGVLRPDEIITLDDSEKVITDDGIWYQFGGGYIDAQYLKEISKEEIRNVIQKKMNIMREKDAQLKRLQLDIEILRDQIYSDCEKI